MEYTSNHPNGKLCGLKTLILFFLFLAFAVLIYSRTIDRFLSPTDKNDFVKILVVEGLTPDFALPGAIEEFRTFNYNLLFCTGIPLEQGSFLSDYKNAAEVTAATLIELGFSNDSLLVVATGDIQRDRTYASAVALANYLKKNFPKNQSINLYSLGAHSRRSQFLFEKALGPEYEVGIIAAPDIRYDSSTWWKSSNGFRTVIDETIAWVYARFFFHPEI